MIQFSTFSIPSLTSTRPHRHAMEWPDLSEALMVHKRVRRKEDAPGWTPAVYEEGSTRSKASTVSVSLAVADFDHVSFNELETVKSRLADLGLTYVLTSTYSCDPPDDVRFRVVVPLTEPVSAHDWPEAWHRINWHVFGGKNDPQTKDCSRFFYATSAPPDGLVFAEQHDGAFLDPTDLPVAPVASVEEDHVPIDMGAVYEGIPEGERDWTLFRLACDLRGKDVPIEYALLTVAEAARRCSPPFPVADAEAKVHQAYARFQPNPKLRTNGTASTQEPIENVPPFPLDCLPDVIREYVERVAATKTLPPEYVAVPMLVSAGTALGHVVRLRLNSTWYEGPQMFAAIIGGPGRKKSPALFAAMLPTSRISDRLNSEYRFLAASYKDDVEHLKALTKEERAKFEQPVAPVRQRVKVEDVTMEKLGELLSLSKGLILIHDELSAWVASMNQYRSGKGSDRQKYLSMWNGRGIDIARKTGPDIIVSRTCLGVVGGIQPEMLNALADERGRSDGFLDRILWAYPEPVKDQWVRDDDDLDTTGLCELWERLYEQRSGTTTKGAQIPETVTFSPEAETLWSQWYDDHGADQDDPNFSSSLGGPWSKMSAHLARITLILHYLEGSETTRISIGTLHRGIRIVEYFKAHARRVYSEFGDARSRDDLKILEALTHGEMSTRDLTQKVFRGHVSGEKLRVILADLEEHGLISQRAQETKGRPGTLWGLVRE